jgi:hypothetical protein
MNELKTQLVAGPGVTPDPFELTIKQRAQLMKHLFDTKLIPVLAVKGEDYSRYASKEATKANANFGALADMFKGSKLDKYHVWAVFMMKHIQAILTWVSQRKLEDEGIQGRFTDATNYLMIGWTMLIEDGVIPVDEAVPLFEPDEEIK